MTIAAVSWTADLPVGRGADVGFLWLTSAPASFSQRTRNIATPRRVGAFSYEECVRAAVQLGLASLSGGGRDADSMARSINRGRRSRCASPLVLAPRRCWPRARR